MILSILKYALNGIWPKYGTIEERYLFITFLKIETVAECRKITFEKSLVFILVSFTLKGEAQL